MCQEFSSWITDFNFGLLSVFHTHFIASNFVYYVFSDSQVCLMTVLGLRFSLDFNLWLVMDMEEESLFDLFVLRKWWCCLHSS